MQEKQKRQRKMVRHEVTEGEFIGILKRVCRPVGQPEDKRRNAKSAQDILDKKRGTRSHDETKI